MLFKHPRRGPPASKSSKSKDKQASRERIWGKGTITGNVNTRQFSHCKQNNRSGFKCEPGRDLADELREVIPCIGTMREKSREVFI